jgi:hypothetical protein
MKAVRMLGGLLGLAGILMGVLFLIFPEEHNVWRRWVVPIGFLGAGWYFLGYAFTGTRSLFWFRRKSIRK